MSGLSPTKYFYRFSPIRNTEEILLDLKEIDHQISELFEEVTK